MIFNEGDIHDVEVRFLDKHFDKQGWLIEIFRQDELSNGFEPAMCCVSLMLPGIRQEPHEHRQQTDCFVFPGPGDFQITLWDMREDSPTRHIRQTIIAGNLAPTLVTVPPGVVHGYKNLSTDPGLVINCPNRLFAGWGRNFPIDEIRHEEKESSPFIMIDHKLQPPFTGA